MTALHKKRRFFRTLNADELQELDQWLTTKEIKLNNRTCRDLSNVVNVAQLCKKLNESLVDTYNYSSYCSLALKLDNWEIFNLKVLRKLGYTLTRQELEQLASGSLTALKSLLYHLMCAERKGLDHFLSKTARKSGGDIRKSRDRLVPRPSYKMPTEDQLAIGKGTHKNVSYSKYKQLIEESRKKEKYITSASNKVQYLQSLILVKEERINKLSERLAALSAKAPLKI